ncbi:MAG TPA: LysR family transcriptional regulator [Pseudonocardiaceae bacterium]
MTKQTPLRTSPQPPALRRAEDLPERVARSLAPRLAMLRAVAAEGGLTRAAELLDIPQPTVSRWLANLSTELGTPVLVRDGRGVRLTRAGRHLADAADRALAVLAAGCRAAEDELDPERGRVVFAFLHTMGGTRVPELLSAYRVDHPHVRFTLVQGGHLDMLNQVRRGNTDLALTSPLPGGTEFKHIALYRQPVIATLPTGHRFADRGAIRLAALADEPFVGFKHGLGMRQMSDELCQAAGFEPELAFEGDQVETLRGLVAAGLGVAILPAAEGMPAPGTVEMPLRPAVQRSIGLVWSARRPLPPAALAFRDFVASMRW